MTDNEVKVATSTLSSAQSVFNAIAGAGQKSAAAEALALGTGALLAAGSAIAYEIKEYKEEAFLEEARQAQALKRKFMPESPDIFTFDEQSNKLVSARSIVLNQALREDLTTDKSQDGDPFLIPFKKAITESLKIDLRFFNERLAHGTKHETDVTASMLTWIMQIKNKHILNFEGCAADIKILDQLIDLMAHFIAIGRTGLAGFFLGRDPHDRERFDALIESIRKLEEARDLLYDHQNTRNMRDFVSEMMSVSNKDFIPQVGSLFIETMIPVDEWELVKTAQEDDLIKGNLLPEQMRHGFISHFAKTKKPVEIPDSIFKVWLQRNLVSAKKRQTSDQLEDYQCSQEDLNQIKNIFKICDNFFTRKAPQRQSNGEYIAGRRFVPVGHDESCYVLYADKEPPIGVEDSFYLVRSGSSWSLYETNRNLKLVKIGINEVPGLAQIIASSTGGKLADHQKKINEVLTVYRNHKQLTSRINSIRSEAILHEMMVDLGVSSALFLGAIIDLGVVYMQDPHHCNSLIGAYEAFGEAIKARANALLRDMRIIRQEQKGAKDFLIGAQRDMMVNLQKKLTSIREKTTVFMDNIVGRHHARATSIGNLQPKAVSDLAEYNKPEYQKAIKPLMAMMSKLCKKYNLKFDQAHPVLTALPPTQELKSEPQSSLSLTALPPSASSSSAIEHKDSKDSDHIMDHMIATLSFKRGSREAAPLLSRQGSSTEEVAPPAFHEYQSPRLSESESKVTPAPIRHEQPQQNLPEEKKYEQEDEDYLASLLAQIQVRISEISNQEKPDGDARRAYNGLYTALTRFDTKSKTLMLEKDPGRQQKGEVIRELGCELARNTLNYLKLDLKARKSAAANFNDEIQEKLRLPAYKVLDQHKNLFWHFLKAAKQVLLCLCGGYGIYDAVKQGGFAVTASRAMVSQVQASMNDLEVRIRRK